MYNLNRKLEELEVQGKSIKIAIIGAGHMGTGMVSQVVNMKGMIPSIVADINVDLWRSCCSWQTDSSSMPDRLRSRAGYTAAARCASR